MSAPDAASDARRKADIEAKKVKLAEIRRQREERALRIKTNSSASASGSVTPAIPTSSRKDLDELVNSLISGSANTEDGSVASGYASPRKSVLSRASGPASSEIGESEPESIPPLPQATADVSAPSQMIETQTELYELPQKQRVYYTKQVQTTETGTSTDTGLSSDVGAEARVTEAEEALRARILAEHAAEVTAQKEEERLEQEIQAQLRELTAEERLAVYSANDFGDFVQHSSKIVERAMADKYDYMVDYRAATQEDTASSSSQLRLVRTFAAASTDAKLFENRSVTALDWSTRYPELCVAAYNRNSQDEDSPDGLVAVWNMHLRDRPEFVFYAQTDVVSVCFSPFHPTLIIGGTYSGQILIWDTRARRLPVLKTPLSAAGHTHPVYGLKMIGSANANNLVSASTDGSLCWWMLDMLARPQETLELTWPLHPKTDEVAITTLGVAEQESMALLVGTEQGTVFAANRYDRAGLKAGVNVDQVYRGHLAPVTGIDFHPLSQSYLQQQDASASAPTQRHAGVDFSDLFLTSSMDWTSKLWRLAPSTSTTRTDTSGESSLLTFEESNDHIYDVKWSTTHPAVFGQVDGTGRFDVFNLNIDTERPVASAFPNDAGKGLNKLSWSKSGKNVALGGSDGRVYIYEVPDPFVTPTEQDFVQLQKTLTQLLAK